MQVSVLYSFRFLVSRYKFLNVMFHVPSCRVVLSSHPSPHPNVRVMRKSLFTRRTPSAWTVWRYVTRRRSLLCRDALIDIASGRRREVMRFRVRLASLRSVLLVRRQLLHRFIMRKLLHRVYCSLIDLSGICPLCVLVLYCIHICVGHVFILRRLILGSWHELICT